MLRLARCRLEVSTRTLMMIDSLEMKDADRRLVVESCASCEESRIVVTHGTDTMPETARALVAAGLAAKGKTGGLTGGVIPYALGRSRRLFKLRSAPSLVHGLSPR